MFKDLPESVNYKEDNRKKLISLAFISILWICSFSTSTVANIMFYDAQLEEKLQLITFCHVPPPTPSCSSKKMPYSFQLYFPPYTHRTGCNFGRYTFFEDTSAEPIIDDSNAVSYSEKIISSEKLIRSIAIHQVDAETPALAKTVGIRGKVVVTVLINEEGKVFSAKVISGHPFLQQAALKAAKEWTFKPKVVDGSPVKVESILTFKFS